MVCSKVGAMAGRLVGAVLGLAVLAGIGVTTGYAVGQSRVEEPTSFAAPMAVPAAQPSFPVNVYAVEPDPATDPLETGLPMQEARFRAGGFKLRAPVPVGWRRVDVSSDRSQFSVASNPQNTYLLRIEILAGDTQSTGVQARSRIDALRSQEADGNAENLIIEDESETGFTYTAIDIGGFQRVGIERFATMPGNSSAYFAVAVTGREVDREGMLALIDRVVEGAYVP